MISAFRISDRYAMLTITSALLAGATCPSIRAFGKAGIDTSIGPDSRTGRAEWATPISATYDRLGLRLRLVLRLRLRCIWATVNTCPRAIWAFAHTRITCRPRVDGIGSTPGGTNALPLRIHRCRPDECEEDKKFGPAHCSWLPRPGTNIMSNFRFTSISILFEFLEHPAANRPIQIVFVLFHFGRFRHRFSDYYRPRIHRALRVPLIRPRF
jgi:hypothetical protein